jgi:hypothetical protein
MNETEGQHMFNKANTVDALSEAFRRKNGKLAQKKLSIRELAAARRHLMNEYKARLALIVNNP